MRLAVVSVKGGVGKTALTAGIGAALARQGISTLVVDADPQGSLTQSLGISPRRTLASALLEGAPLTTAIVEIRPKLSLIPADRTVAAIEGWLYGDPARRTALRDALKPLDAVYELTLIDTPPGHSMTNVTAYLAADGLVVPCSPDGLSLQGVRGVEENLALLERDGLPAPPIVACVPTFADRRHSRTAVVEHALGLHFGERCGPPLRVCSAVPIAMANGQVIFEMAPRSTAAADFDAIAIHLQALLFTQATVVKAVKEATQATDST